MSPNDVISYWLETAEEDLKTAGELLGLKRYHHALFFCHLALEKLLKGLVYKRTKNHPLPIHDLAKLAQQTGVSFPDTHMQDLEEITTWNIQARYDTIKRSFYKKATREFSSLWFGKVKEIFVWIKRQY